MDGFNDAVFTDHATWVIYGSGWGGGQTLLKKQTGVAGHLLATAIIHHHLTQQVTCRLDLEYL